jgi:hypothetical protein
LLLLDHNNYMKPYLILSSLGSLAFLFVLPLVTKPTLAYYSNMPASVVVGQSNFTENSTGVSSITFGNATIRGLFVDPKGRLIATDGGNAGNNRVLIWNRLPTTNGQAADLVLGQPNFTSNTANNGGRSAQTLSTPGGVFSDGDKLYVVDGGNGRVLIWNTFPTVNQQPADLVVGQADMTTVSSTCDASHLIPSTNGNFVGVFVRDGKLFVADNAGRRVLIWNSIPTTNGVAADVVVGQANMTTCSAQTTSATSLGNPRGVNVDSHGRLFVVDGLGANRVLMWNTVPTSNNAPSDVVIGQPDFVSTSTPLT